MKMKMPRLFRKKSKSTKSKKLNTHVTHNVVVKDGSAPSWRGNLKLLASRSISRMSLRNVSSKLLANESTWSISNSTDNMSCTSSSDDIVHSDKSKGVFTFYQKGDGSAEDPDRIPKRYLDVMNQDRAKAIEAVKKTVQWREENGINDMLTKPHTNFDICKAAVPHYYVGRDAQGHVVYVQRPALVDMELCKAHGVTHHDLLMHSIYIQEYLWQIIEADDPTAIVTSIIDAGDNVMSFGDLRRKDDLKLLINMLMALDTHFPMRGYKTLIINAPSWFNMLWRSIKPLLKESTTDQIEICAKGKNQDAILLRTIGEETCRLVPDFCWSRPTKPTTASIAELQMEKDLRAYVLSRLEASGETMAPILRQQTGVSDKANK